MRRERDLLLQKVLNPPAEITPALAPEPLTTFTPRHKPWRMKQQELEMEDKIQAARIRKEFEERTASLENQLGVPNGVPTRKEEERGYDGRGLGESG
jgi:hypothetical protein